MKTIISSNEADAVAIAFYNLRAVVCTTRYASDFDKAVEQESKELKSFSFADYLQTEDARVLVWAMVVDCALSDVKKTISQLYSLREGLRTITMIAARLYEEYPEAMEQFKKLAAPVVEIRSDMFRRIVNY